MPLNIKPLRETLNVSYTRPDISKVETYEGELWNLHQCAGLEYLRNERGLTDETIKHFRLGYCGERGAVTIPIFKNGELVQIKYRFLNPTGPKYIGETGAENWVYNEEGFAAARKHGRILIVEGEFDLMSVWQAGIKNAVSPASGKNSYGPWIERLDAIPEVFIAYDNDVPGREAGQEMAQRIGIEKCFEVKYPDGIKDANEYFKSHGLDDFKSILSVAKAYTSYKFQGVGDIINTLRNKKDDTVEIPFIPRVKLEKDWLVVLSGRSNAGKTSYSMNLAESLADQGHAVLIMPFERGIESVGKRLLQVKFDKTLNEFRESSEEEWDKMTSECIETPIYFALPKKDEIIETIVSARRIFNTKFVIIDHLDYVVRNTTGSKEAEIGQTLQELKRVAEENGVCMLIVTHVRKIDQAGSLLNTKAPGIEDLKGSASLYQDPECVIMLNRDSENEMTVSILKNKGEMTNQTFEFNPSTGRMKVSLFDSM